MYVIGGSSKTEVFNDVWASKDGETWTELTVGEDFPKFYGHSCEIIKNSIVIAGKSLWASCPSTGFTENSKLCHKNVTDCLNYSGEEIDKCVDCIESKYLSGSNTCTDCTKCLQSDDKYQQTMCQKSTDAACAECSKCKTGEYESKLCGELDTKCDECSGCDVDEQIDEECATQADTKCAKCNAGCTLGEYFPAEKCDGTNKNTCKGCDCTKGEYASGGC